MLMHIVMPCNKGHLGGFIGRGERRGTKGDREGEDREVETSLWGQQ